MSTPSKKVFVGSLSWSTTDATLKEFFEQVGTVITANVCTDRDTGRSRGFGFVEMASIDDAGRAVEKLNRRKLDGREIAVEFANPRPSSGGGRSGGYQRDDDRPLGRNRG